MTQDPTLSAPDVEARIVGSTATEPGSQSNGPSNGSASPGKWDDRKTAADELGTAPETLDAEAWSAKLDTPTEGDLRRSKRAIRAEVLLDPAGLYLLRTAIEGDGIHVRELEGHIANGAGWARVIRLLQAGLVELTGDFILPTDLGRNSYEEISKLLHASG